MGFRCSCGVVWVLKANVGLLCVFYCCAATLILSFLAFFSPCDFFAFLCSLQFVFVASFASVRERSAFPLFIVDGFSYSVLDWLWLSCFFFFPFSFDEPPFFFFELVQVPVAMMLVVVHFPASSVPSLFHFFRFSWSWPSVAFGVLAMGMSALCG